MRAACRHIPGSPGLIVGIGLVCCLLAPRATYADDRPPAVRVQPAGPSFAHAAPGEGVSVGFVISNPSAEPLTVRSVVGLPDGWASLFNAPPVEIAPQGQVLRLVNVRVPAHTTPGTYTVRLRVEDTAETVRPGEATVTVHVRAVHGLTVTGVGAPRTAEAGTSFEAEFLVTNTGNTRVFVQLEARVGSGTVEVPRAELDLDVGAAAPVVVMVTAPRELRQKRRQTVRLEARVGAEEETVAAASVRTMVMPGRGAADEDATGYPIELTVSAAGSDGGLGPQLQIGSVPARRPEAERFAFLVRPPSSQPVSLYVPNDEYRLRYHVDGRTVLLGDHVFGLTTLTSTGQYGFGGALRVEEERHAVEGYYLRSRLPGDHTAQGGVRVEHTIEDRGDFGFNFVGMGGGQAGQLASASVRVSPYEGAEAEAEAGLSSAAGRAIGARLAGHHPTVSYEGRFLHASPDYLGSYRGTDLRALAATVRPREWLHLDGAWRDHARTYEALGVEAAERREEFLKGGVGVQSLVFGQRARVSVALQQRTLDTWTNGLDRQQWERGIHVRAGLDVRRAVSLTGSVRWGEVHRTEQAVPPRFFQAGVRTRLVLGRHTLSTSLDYARGPTLHIPRARDRWQTSARWTSRVGRRTRLSLHAYVQMDRSPPSRHYAAAQLHLDHEFRSGHRLTVRGRFSEIGGPFDERDAAYAVSYTVPFRLTDPRASRRAALTGEVFHAETGAPIAGARLHLGGTTVLTEADGTFAIPAPPPGTHYLRLDPASVGLVYTTMKAMPLEIVVGEDAVPPIRIPVIQSGSVEGRVALHAFAGGQTQGEIVEAGGLEGVVLELADGEGRVRVVTDEEGRFRLRGLRPGQWHLRVVHAPLPERHSFDREAVDVHVAAGGTASVRLDVRPHRRAIRILGSGSLTVEQRGGPSSGD